MKIDRRRKALLALSLLTLFTATNAAKPKIPTKEEIIEVEQDTLAAVQVDGPIAVAATAAKKGTSNAPVDGQDGMPHDGPWVETNAGRERKKTNDDPDDPVTLKTFKDSLKDKVIPESNNGVMDDPARKAPLDGTRGTEGGVSEKSKNKDGASTPDEKSGLKKPAAPKEVPELPSSGKEKTKGKEATSEDNPTLVSEEKEKKKQLLEVSQMDDSIRPVTNNTQKPTDLPEKPHSIPHPENPSSPKDHGIINPDTNSHSSLKSNNPPSTDPEAGVIQPLHSLLLSFTMILVSEIGDKTFLVACLMAMRHDRILVFSAAYSALVTMTVLSAVLGHAVPTLIPKNVTNFLAAGLFLIFGVKMLLEARSISPDEGVSEEMKEVEMELEEKEQHAQHAARRSSRRQSDMAPNSLYLLESGRNKNISPTSSASSSRSNSPSRKSSLKSTLSGINNLFSLLLSPAWVQTFVMTFLGEWGDRSQIATIAMAAGQDYWWVTGGALGGHAICTGVAVLGGKAIAGRVSLRTVTMGGAFAFLIFGVIYLLEAVY